MYDQGQPKTEVQRKSQPKYVYRYYCVAFLDILNQREKLRKMKSLPENAEEYATFQIQVKETLGAVQLFRDLFSRFFASFSKERPIPNGLNEKQLAFFIQLKESAKQCVPKIQTFSDTTIIYVPISDNEESVYADGICTTLQSIAGAFLAMMASGAIFRGGIDIGLAAEIDSREVYGPAVLNAYELESRVAKYPRIVVGAEMEGFLKNAITLSEADPQNKFNKVMAAKSLELLFEDGDGRLVLDYLGNGYREIAGKVVAPFIPKAIEFMQQQGEIIRKTKNVDLFMRYQSLSSYFDEQLPAWGDLLEGIEESAPNGPKEKP